MVYNTGETAEELKAKYNPDGSILRKAQLRMLDMLLFLDGVFKEIGVPYRLDGGNILGAIRHGGFIPWDDDIDIIVYPGGLKKLRHYFETHSNLQYVLQNHKTDKGYYAHGWDVLRDLKSEYIVDSPKHQTRKYKGLQVDIFTYESGHNYTLHRIGGWLYEHWFGAFLGKSRFLCEIGYYMFDYFVFPIFRFLDIIVGDKDYYMHAYGPFFNCRFYKDIMLPHKEIMFEGHLFPGPAKPEDFLRELYGDYMKLPPIDKRAHHNATYKVWD